ncbi:extracellular solute-binding protein [Clostridium sp. KNHs205]|uniref:extracellular solute-binding protein n=1 Tax=Clostridium sp. KNHs205 TaxID=1449050 RepID=UPI00051B55BB|nr:extracellular solute-binding protein [Clostridium sp. KNHs205]
MKNMKKIFVMFICLAMVFSSLSACKKSESKDNNTSDPTEGAKELINIDYSKPVEYSYWLYSTPGDYNSDYNKNPVVKYLNKKFNMTLSFQQPASGADTDSLNIMLGTGEYTDIIDSNYYTGSINQLFTDGVIIDIAKYLDYMPNLKALLETDDKLRKNTYNDEGQLLKLPIVSTDNENAWGGLVYRRDILKTMTGDNISFPSGNESPITIADWDYMLPLYKQYFEAAGMKDYAPLILPAKGYFDSGDILTGFGTAPNYYVDNGTIKYGPMQDGFYNYLVKMKEWYKNGYIYKDFASRTNDLFYMPNTALTYGGAAGVWYGLGSQLGDTLSMPDYGLYVDVQPVANPIDKEHGVTTAPNLVYTGKNERTGGTMITSSCKNVERLLATIDYLYSEEGSYLKEYGLTKEQGAAENELYVNNGLADGTYTKNTDGTLNFNSKTTFNGGSLPLAEFADVRMPGLANNKYTIEASMDIEKEATATWLSYGTTGKLPSIQRTTEEESTYSNNQAKIDDYVNTMVLKFILGDEELSENSWSNFKTQLEAYGVNDNIAIQQTAFDRYEAR